MTARLLALFDRLLGVFPEPFRSEYREEVVGVLADQLRGRPPARQLRVFVAAVADLASAAPAEHRATARAPLPLPAGGPAPGAPQRRGHRVLPSRRRFLRAAILASGAVAGSSIGGATIAYLWPRSGGGFGSVVDVGSLQEVVAGLAAAEGSLAVPAARTWLVGYDAADDPDGIYASITGGAGVMALYQKCVHLGCRVPWCASSAWFECPCHGSAYNRWGEYQAGPAPRGLDRFAVAVVEDRVLVDTRTIVTGPARTVDTLGEGRTGPACVRR